MARWLGGKVARLLLHRFSTLAPKMGDCSIALPDLPSTSSIIPARSDASRRLEHHASHAGMDSDKALWSDQAWLANPSKMRGTGTVICDRSY